jgi:glycosyltransferase involved in cell wall biosynthesis
MKRTPAVSVVIPTLARPLQLQCALRSLFGQLGVEAKQIEAVVVDNDPGGSAAELVATLGKRAAISVRYVAEPRPGVAYARNAGVGAARAPLIAFLDDDQIASPGWLAGLMASQARLDADVVFGPIDGVVTGADRRLDRYLSNFFSRFGPCEERLLDRYWGCGNSLLRRSALPHPKAPFSAERNEIGGEDDLLFGTMKSAGARFGWSPDAWVQEMAPRERAQLSYVLRRAFAYGQGPASSAMAANPPRRAEAAGWMAKGLVQAALFGALAGWRLLTGKPDWPEALDRAVRGLGKTFWFGPFKIRFYGAAALPALPLAADEAAGWPTAMPRAA